MMDKVRSTAMEGFSSGRAASAAARRLSFRARTGERRIFFGRDLGFRDTPIYDRDRLEPGHEVDGPAVVEQMDTTTVIHPEQQARVDDYKNLIITAKG